MPRELEVSMAPKKGNELTNIAHLSNDPRICKGILKQDYSKSAILSLA